MAEEDVRRSPRRRGRLGLVVLLLGVAIWFVRSRRAAADARVQPWPGGQPVPAIVPPVPAQQPRSPSRASATIAPSPITAGSGTTTDAPSTPPAQAVPVEPAQAAPEAPAAVAAAAAPEPVEPAEAVPAAPAVSDPAAATAPVEPESGAASADQAAEAVPVPDEPLAPAPVGGKAQAKPDPATPPVSETSASMLEPVAPATDGAVTSGSTSSPDDAETEILPVQPAVSWARPVEPEPHSLFTPAPPRRASPRSDRPSPRRRKPSPSPQAAALPPGAVAAAPDGSAPDAEYTIKASTGSLLFHTPASPYFRRTKAEIWFRSPADARAAGFTEWTPKKRTES
jgi:hypothetical protein